MRNKKNKDNDPYSLRDIYDEMELDLINSFGRNLAKHTNEEEMRGFSWEMWQKAKLRNIREYRKETTSIIYRFRKRIKRAIETVINKHFSNGERKATINMPKDGANTGLVGKVPPKETQFFGVNKKKLDALVKSTTKDFSDAEKAIYRKMDDTYRQTIFKAVYQMSSGTVSLGQAIDKATNDFLQQGINCITYKNGRRVNIADYAEMALRTASHRATLLGEGSKRDELGVHLIFVSAHANCCKLCVKWQGQILIDDVFSHPNKEYIAEYKSKYKLLSEAIKAGLLHPNCRHSLATYFKGVTRLPAIQDPRTALMNYNNEQKQRALEREIRKRKRILAGTVDEDDRKEANVNLRVAQKNLRQFLVNHPEFKQSQRRVKVYDASATLGSGNKSIISKSEGDYVETIDLKDVDKYIKTYENEIKDYPVEHAYVIQGDGKVMRYVGDEQGVSFPTENLKGAFITHNHPIIDGESSNSFQKDDFSFLQSYGRDIKRLRATYGDERYDVMVLKDISTVSYGEMMNRVSVDVDIFADFVDFGDLVFKLLDKEGFVVYAKTKVK